MSRDFIRDKIKNEEFKKRKKIREKLILDLIKKDNKNKESPDLKVSSIDECYKVSVNDNSLNNPFLISPTLVKIIRKNVEYYKSLEEKSLSIFNWMQRNIVYGSENRKHGYRNSHETLEDKRGVCGEMAFLYITMARCCGLKSFYTSVEKDFQGKEVLHACASVNLTSKEILVDPAYHTYDIKHLEYKVLSDSEVIEKFNRWRFND